MQVGDAAVGAASGDCFGPSASTSSDGKTFAAGAYKNDDNGMDSGHVRILNVENVILAKEHGWCQNQPGDVQEDGRAQLSTESFQSIEDASECRQPCAKHARLRFIFPTGCETSWGESSFNGCCLHVNHLARSVGAHKRPC